MEQTLYLDNEPKDTDYADGLYAVYGSEEAIKAEMMRSGKTEMTVGVYQLVKTETYKLMVEYSVLKVNNG